MKIKVSKKAVSSSGASIFKFGANELQSLLIDRTPTMYSCSTPGWDCDYYTFEEHNIIICVGYRPIGADVDSKITEKYEARAKKLLKNCNYSGINKLLKEFINELRKC